MIIINSFVYKKILKCPLHPFDVHILYSVELCLASYDIKRDDLYHGLIIQNHHV